MIKYSEKELETFLSSSNINELTIVCYDSASVQNMYWEIRQYLDDKVSNSILRPELGVIKIDDKTIHLLNFNAHQNAFRGRPIQMLADERVNEIINKVQFLLARCNV